MTNISHNEPATQQDHRPILVLGGTGKVGRRVAHNLAKQQIPVRIGSRSGAPAFEWTDRRNWTEVIAGCCAIFISYVPDLAVPGAADDIAALIAIAREQGVEHLVVLSGRGEPEARRCEQLIEASGLSWTICRAGWFMQDFSESFMYDAVMSETLAFPGGSMVEPWVDCDDIADVATAALIDSKHHGQTYAITGPALLTFADIAIALSKATGRSIRYAPLSLDAFIEHLHDATVPADIVDLMAYLFGEVFDGRNATVEDGVQRALGRPPRSIDDFTQKAANQGTWYKAEGDNHVD